MNRILNNFKNIRSARFNKLIYQIPEVFNVRFIDTIDNSLELEKTIYKNLTDVKLVDISFFTKFHYELEAQLQTLNKTSVEIFLINELQTIPSKRKYIVSFLQGKLLGLVEIIRSMATKLSEDERT